MKRVYLHINIPLPNVDSVTNMTVVEDVKHIISPVINRVETIIHRQLMNR